MTTQFVSPGVVSSGVVVTSGDTLEILSGGVADVTSAHSICRRWFDSRRSPRFYARDADVHLGLRSFAAARSNHKRDQIFAGYQ